MITSSRARFELYDLGDARSDVPCTAFADSDHIEPASHMLAIADDGTTWVGFDADTSTPVAVADSSVAEFGVLVVQRKVARELALVPLRDGVLVNSIPALGLTLLGTRDSISAGAGRLLFVTQRVCPHVGAPTEDMLAVRMKCPFCKLTVTPDTCVVSCRCGAIYHHETEASHPQLTPEDLLNCQAKISTCLACGQLVSLDEALVWDPVTL
jgi:hypothetical protein